MAPAILIHLNCPRNCPRYVDLTKNKTTNPGFKMKQKKLTLAEKVRLGIPKPAQSDFELKRSRQNQYETLPHKRTT